jgi:hypothetical protein
MTKQPVADGRALRPRRRRALHRRQTGSTTRAECEGVASSASRFRRSRKAPTRTRMIEMALVALVEPLRLFHPVLVVFPYR